MTTTPITSPHGRDVPATRPAPNGGKLGLFWLHIVTTLKSDLRSVEFAVGAVAIPVVLYVMFGLPNASNTLPGGTRVGAAMLVSLAAYGVVSLAIFHFGEYIAKERGRGWIRTLSATPFPTATYLGGKSVVSMVHAGLIVVALSLLAGTVGGVSESPATWLVFAVTMVSGVVLFSTLGFAIAYVARPRAAAVIANLIFLPLSFASGFFMPLSELPDMVGNIARYLPTFHFGQLAYRTLMPLEDIASWTGAATRPAWVHLVWVLGSAAVFGAIALWAARREAVTRRG